MNLTPLDLDEEVAFELRDYQREWMANTAKDRAAGFSRLLLDAVGGSGKTSYAGAIMLEEWRTKQGRTLILENRQQLVVQTAKRIRDETGLEVDVEMAEHTASPYAQVVVASVASLGRLNRLTAFADTHFAVVFADEAHNSTANLFLRIMRYFTFGAESLAEGWVQPKDGTYKPKACIIGITATPDTHGKRNLGNFFQKFTARYSYLQAIEDGWLVGVKEENIPVKIDTRKFRRKMSGHGTDFSAEDESAAIIPIIEELAEQIVRLAKDRKTMCFLPSKECTVLMAAALNRRGLEAISVVGESLDRDDNTEYFQHHGPRICMCLCALYVEGTDFPNVDTVAWMRATISPSFYKQGVFRMSRVLPGVVSNRMTAAHRRQAIAASGKPYGLLISPFFVSEKIDIMRAADLFVDEELKSKMKKAPSDFTDPSKIRDFIAALEKAADKHSHRQPRTINPVTFCLSIGAEAIANYEPETSADSKVPTRGELDFLLAHGIDSSAIKNSGQAQKIIARVLERENLGLASPGQLDFLRKLTVEKDGARVPMYKDDWILTIRKSTAGALIGKQQMRWQR